MAPPTTAAQLPGALLASILQHVPQKQRQTSCAVVCKAWAAAAAAATTSVSVVPSEAVLEWVLPSLETWLQQHGSNLVSLEVDRPYGALLLPCAALVQLTSLSLQGLVVRTSFEPPQPEQQQSARPSSTPGVLAVLPHLLRLKLDSCQLSSPAAFQRLTASPGLTALDLQCVWWEAEPTQEQSTAAEAAPSSALAAVLKACSRLRKLHLMFPTQWNCSVSNCRACMPPSSLSVLSRLLQLQDLTLSDLYLPVGSTAGSWPALPASLTRLCLVREDPQLPDQARELTHLQALELRDVSFKPRVLSGMSQLLQLKVCIGIFDGDLLPADGDTQPPFALLLAAIAGLTQLQQLHLWAWEQADMRGVQPQAFAGFTASRQLQALHLKLSIPSTQQEAMPGRELIRHMFPDGRHLTQLQSLVLGATVSDDCWCVPASDLARIAASCPSLQTLGVSNLLERRADLTTLLQFTGLRSLCVGGLGFDDAGAVLVAQLTQLTSLEWECPHEAELYSAGLMQLAALTALQQLVLSRGEDEDVDRCILEQELDCEFPVRIDACAEDGPVWVQIYRVLGVPEPVLDLLQQRQQQSCAELQQVQQLRSRVAELEQQVVQLQGEASGSLPG